MRTVLLDGLWGAPWRMSGMRRTLQKRGCGPVENFGYDSSGMVPIELLADQMARFLGTNPVRVVAHSMGGIITRLAVMRHPGLQLRAAAFLCVPHHGSKLARVAPMPGARQLAPESPLIRKLAQQQWKIPTMTVWCPGDLMVVPGHGARWDKACLEICCPVPLHNWPVISPAYHHLVADFFLSL